VEEVLRPVLGGYEAEAAIADQLLDRPKGHLSTLAPSPAVTLASWVLCAALSARASKSLFATAPATVSRSMSSQFPGAGEHAA
jgi:hypothetical protein